MIMLAKGRLRAGVLLAGFAALAGCGGSGGSLVVRSVPYEKPVTQTDYVGKTFPVFFLVGEAGDPSGDAVAGRGTITYNTNDTVTMQLPGRAPVIFTPTGSTALGTTYQASSGNASTIDAVVTGLASTDALRLVTSVGDQRSFLGGFGFETLAADREPLPTATYNTAGAVFLTATNAEDFLPVAGDGTLIANFGSGMISGTFLSTDPVEVQLAGSAGTPDELALRFMLQNGQITPSGFSGGVTATGELVVDGSGPPLALDAAIANGSAEGAFFGEEAAAVSGIFEGDLALSEGGTSLADFEAAGFVSGAKQP